MDFIKGSCTRPFCKYLHPPVHLQEYVRNRQNKSYAGSYYTVPNSPGPLIPTVVPQQGYQLQGSSYFVNQPQTVYPQYQQVYMPVSSYPMYAPYPAMQVSLCEHTHMVHICTHTSTHARTHAHARAHTHTHTHARTHTHTQSMYYS